MAQLVERGHWRVAGSRLTMGRATVLCPWARSFICSLVLVQHRKTVPTWQKNCWLGHKESNQTKSRSDIIPFITWRRVWEWYNTMGHVAQSVMCLATDASLTADPEVASSILTRSHTFVEIDHKIISTVILLPSAESFKKGCCQLQAKVCAQSTG